MNEILANECGLEFVKCFTDSAKKKLDRKIFKNFNKIVI